MKIALCSPVSLSYWGGAEKWIAYAAKLLQRRGHDVDVYALPRSPGKKSAHISEMLGDIDYHEDWHSEIEADVVYFNYQPLFWRLTTSREPRIAGMHSPHLFENYGSPLFWTFRLLGRKDLSSFDAVHTVGPYNSAFKHQSVYNIPNWVDTSFFKPHREVSDRFTLLFAGKHRKEKGWQTFLNLASKMRGLGDDFIFVCTGEGKGNVKGLGFVKESELPRVYSNAQVLVHPASADIFSLTIVEALACGVPVVTFPSIAHRNMGLPLCYASTTSELVERVLVLYRMWKNASGRYAEICSEARSSSLSYDIKKIFPRIEKMFKEVAKG